ncbi:peptidase family M48-domain-containing protein [Scheffersomyces coipomensis]|uniref:peptidase family M48-domain-containing protein n=1 Tax=Scheffersomyces coipomensis TaxID=1788519 RepID=UPI00315DA895
MLNFFNLFQPDWKSVSIAFLSAKFMFESYLKLRQHNILSRTVAPSSSNEELDQESFEKRQEYSRVKSKYKLIADTLKYFRDLFIIQSNLNSIIWTVSGGILTNSNFLPQTELSQSLIFCTVSKILLFTWKLPFDLYYNFVIEEEFNFNKSTVPDLLISSFIQEFVQWVIDLTIISSFIKLIQYFGRIPIFHLTAVVWLVFTMGFAIYPRIILPLLLKVNPLPEGELRSKIEKLAEDKSFRLNKISAIDGSSSTAHTNALAAGSPWSGTIAIYDNFSDHLSIDEVVSVAAHELGHLKLFHLEQQSIYLSIIVGSKLLFISKFIENKSLYEQFGLPGGTTPFLIGYLIAQDIYIPLEVLGTFIDNYLKRKIETDADYYSAIDCGFKETTASALSKHLKMNLSTVSSDWLYSLYFETHPSAITRLEALNVAIRKHS